MIKLIDLLNEGKQVGILYHFTTFEYLLDILKSNKLLTRTYNIDNPYGKQVISFTRNKDFAKTNKIFWFRLAGNRPIEARLTLDGDKLSNNYHLEPVRDQWVFNSDNPRSKWSKTPKVVKKTKKYYTADESEERLITNKDYIPLKDYLLEIKIIGVDQNTDWVRELVPQEFKNYIK
jgi:hypothetical protein